MAAKQPETVRVKFIDENTIEQCHEKTRRVDVLKDRKRLEKGRLTRTKKKLSDLIVKAQGYAPGNVNLHEKSMDVHR